eukprot:gene3475-3963_t
MEQPDLMNMIAANMSIIAVGGLTCTTDLTYNVLCSTAFAECFAFPVGDKMDPYPCYFKWNEQLDVYPEIGNNFTDGVHSLFIQCRNMTEFKGHNSDDMFVKPSRKYEKIYVACITVAALVLTLVPLGLKAYGYGKGQISNLVTLAYYTWIQKNWDPIIEATKIFVQCISSGGGDTCHLTTIPFGLEMVYVVATRTVGIIMLPTYGFSKKAREIWLESYFFKNRFYDISYTHTNKTKSGSGSGSYQGSPNYRSTPRPNIYKENNNSKNMDSDSQPATIKFKVNYSSDIENQEESDVGTPRDPDMSSTSLDLPLDTNSYTSTASLANRLPDQ